MTECCAACWSSPLCPVLPSQPPTERAKRRFDPRHLFYEAMLSNETYEAYLAAVGDNRGPFSGRGEILYARSNGWIADDPGPASTLPV